jgi:hypothetical protein
MDFILSGQILVIVTKMKERKKESEAVAVHQMKL